MSEPKTRPTGTTLQTFLSGVADPARRADCAAVAELMQQATGEAAVIWGSSIVGFGAYRYRYGNGREADWPLIAFAARKNDLTLYSVFGFDGSDALLARLGRHRTGKGCLYLRSLADVDRDVLADLLRRSVAAREPQRVR